MKSKAHKNKDSPQNCVDSDAVKPEKIKFPLYLHPDTMQQVETLYKVDSCTSKTEFLEKAVRFYCGYLQSENAADFHKVAHFAHVGVTAITGKLSHPSL